jgi:hypothetical protein
MDDLHSCVLKAFERQPIAAGNVPHICGSCEFDCLLIEIG